MIGIWKEDGEPFHRDYLNDEQMQTESITMDAYGLAVQLNDRDESATMTSLPMTILPKMFPVPVRTTVLLEADVQG